MKARYFLFLMFCFLGAFAYGADSSYGLSPAEVQKIRKIVAEQLQVNQSVFGLDTPLSKIGRGGDSLDVVEIIISLEEAFNHEISDANFEAAIGPHTMKDLGPKVSVRKLIKMVSVAKRK